MLLFWLSWLQELMSAALDCLELFVASLWCSYGANGIIAEFFYSLTLLVLNTCIPISASPAFIALGFPCLLAQSYSDNAEERTARYWKSIYPHSWPCVIKFLKDDMTLDFCLLWGRMRALSPASSPYLASAHIDTLIVLMVLICHFISHFLPLDWDLVHPASKSVLQSIPLVDINVFHSLDMPFYSLTLLALLTNRLADDINVFHSNRLADDRRTSQKFIEISMQYYLLQLPACRQ